MLGDPDPVRSQRVMQAMLQMVKLDLPGCDAPTTACEPAARRAATGC